MKAKDRILIDVNMLQELLSCNRQHATRIGKEAKAVIRVGRRNMYSVNRINNYINEHTT